MGENTNGGEGFFDVTISAKKLIVPLSLALSMRRASSLPPGERGYVSSYNKLMFSGCENVFQKKIIELEKSVKSPEVPREWLTTNSYGGYASGPLTGKPFRRYHTLYTHALTPPVGRINLVNWFELFINQQPVEFDSFAYTPAPTFFAEEPVSVNFRLRLPQNKNESYLDIFFENNNIPGSIELEPYFVLRPHDDLRTEPGQFQMTGEGTSDFNPLSLKKHSEPEQIDSGISCLVGVKDCETDCKAFITGYNGHFIPDDSWVKLPLYSEDARRGETEQEFAFKPGRIKLSPDINSQRLIISPEVEVNFSRCGEISRPSLPEENSIDEEKFDLDSTLDWGAEHFIVRRDETLNSIIAGYPWFADWGRDTMLCLEGLCLIDGKLKVARNIISAFGHYLDQGMIPNRFPEEGNQPAYNTVDGTLLWVEAIRLYREYGGKKNFVLETCFPWLKELIDFHLEGTRYGIHYDRETGLLFSGKKGTQLTWMDAKYRGKVVTPRDGYPVEIQALWYNTLSFAAKLAGELEEKRVEEKYSKIARRVREVFKSSYWCQDGYYLDRLDPDGRPDKRLRPNQIFVFAPGFPISADRKRGRQMIRTIDKHLKVPLGLRTLSPEHPEYKGQHTGPREIRDEAYHQGTVWPWLLYPYAKTLEAVFPEQEVKSRLEEISRPFCERLEEAGVGCVSEIFDGSSPHSPRGCFHQAWSVAALRYIRNKVNKM